MRRAYGHFSPRHRFRPRRQRPCPGGIPPRAGAAFSRLAETPSEPRSNTSGVFKKRRFSLFTEALPDPQLTGSWVVIAEPCIDSVIRPRASQKYTIRSRCRLISPWVSCRAPAAYAEHFRNIPSASCQPKGNRAVRRLMR
jgi:hypothetical protein